MSEHIEIEFKNLLTKTEYHMLLDYFQIASKQIKRQINHYFDTPMFSLKEGQLALRIREKATDFEMTLKQPAIIGLLETNQTLQKSDVQKFLQQGIIPVGEIKNKLFSLNIPVEDIHYFGTLTTDRVEMEYQGGTIVFDHSSYLNVEDFEIEYEVNEPITGETIFHEVLAKFNIPIRKTKNKVQRFYQQKYEQGNEL